MEIINFNLKIKSVSNDSFLYLFLLYYKKKIFLNKLLLTTLKTDQQKIYNLNFFDYQ